MADNSVNVVYFLNTQILSSGKVKSVPTLVGPVYNSIFLDVLTVISVFTEGHEVIIETEPDKFIKMTPKVALELMKRYNISNEMIQKLLEQAAYIQTKYDNLDTLQKLADQIIEMLGVPVGNLGSIGLLGQAITAILGTGTIKNFDEVRDKLQLLKESCEKYTDDSIVAIEGTHLKNFLMTEQEIDEVTNALLSFSQTMDEALAAIRNSSLLHSFKEVEDWAKTAVEKQHVQNTDTILDKGGANEVSAEQIVVGLLNLEEAMKDIDALSDAMTYTRRDLRLLEIKYNTFHNGELEDMKTIEEHIKALELLTHEQGTDMVVGKGTSSEILIPDLKAFMLDTLNSLQNLSEQSSVSSADIDELVSVLSAKFQSFLNGETLNTFKAVEEAIQKAIDAVHDQDTDTALDKGGVNEVTAEQIKTAIASYKTSIETLTSSITAILGNSTIDSFDDIESALKTAIDGMHQQNTDTALGEGTDKAITIDDLIYLQEKIQEAVAAGAVIIDEDTIATAMAKFLANTPDNKTIFVEGSKLVAKSLVGLSSAITELNYMNGVKSNVQSQIDALKADYTAKIGALTGGGGFQGYFASFAALLTASAETTFADGIYIVGTDETRSNRTTLYRYDKIALALKYLGTFNIEVRNFTTNPIDLDIETKGILPKNKLSAAFLAEIQAIKDALHTQGSDTVLAQGTLAEVTALEIRNAIDKLNLFTRTSSASLIDDANISGLFTWSSFKINYLMSLMLTKETAYTKGETDAKYALKAEVQTHLNKEDILDELSQDDYGNLKFKDNLVGNNLNLIKKTFELLYESDTLSNIIYIRDYLINKGLIYPTMISIAVQNKSSVAMPFQIVNVQENEEIKYVDIVLDAGESQIYELTTLSSEVYIRSKGKLFVTMTIIAYKMSDYLEAIDTNYHVQGTDSVIGKGTEDEMDVKFIRRSLKKVEALDDEWLHAKNTDTALMVGTEVLEAATIKAKLDSAIGLTQSAIVPITLSPETINIECNKYNKAIIEAFVIEEDSSNSNISQTVTTFLSTEKTAFNSDGIDYVGFDGDMKLIKAVSMIPTRTNYDGGCLSDVDMSLSVPTARVTGITVGTQSTKTIAKVKQDNAANLYMRFGVGNEAIAKDGWTQVVDLECVNGEYFQCTESGVPMKFNFIGDSISLIANLSEELASCAIKIDGQEYLFNQYGVGKNYRVFNIEGLNSMYEHYVEIYLVGTGSINIAAIDVNIASEIHSYDETPARTGGILFYKDGKYFTYENDTYVYKYDALPSSTIFISEGVADVADITNIQTFMFRLFTKSIPKKPIVIDFNISIASEFVRQASKIDVVNVMKNIDFLHISGTNTGMVFSLDEGTTWKVLRNEVLTTVDVTNKTDLETNALTIDEFNLIDWNAYLVDGKINLTLGFFLKDLTSVVSEIILQYDMSAFLKKIDCEYTLKNGTADITVTGYANRKIVITKIQ